jgi:hypothetical protein
MRSQKEECKYLGMLNLFNYVHACSWFGSAVLTKFLTVRARVDELFSQDGWAVGRNRITFTVTGHPRLGGRPREGQRLPQETEILAKARRVVTRDIALPGIAPQSISVQETLETEIPHYTSGVSIYRQLLYTTTPNIHPKTTTGIGGWPLSHLEGVGGGSVCKYRSPHS